MYIIYNNIEDANNLIQRIESKFIPCGVITNSYGSVIKHPIQELYAVPIIDLVRDSLTEIELNSIVELTPDWYPEINE